MVLAVVVQRVGCSSRHLEVDHTALRTVASDASAVCVGLSCALYTVDPEWVATGSNIECVCLTADQNEGFGSDTINDVSRGTRVDNVERGRRG